MPISTCIARQACNKRGIKDPYLECVNCKQGIDILTNDSNLMEKKDMHTARGHQQDTQKGKPSESLCKKCGQKPTISNSSTLCASCMAKLSNEARRHKKDVSDKPKTGDTHTKGRVIQKTHSNGKISRITIEFGKHADLLRSIENIADREIRTVENQIIYILKSHFDALNTPLEGV